jgi:DNA polymerase
MTVNNYCESHPQAPMAEVSAGRDFEIFEVIIGDIKVLPPAEFERRWGDIIPTLSSLVRAFLVPANGCEFFDSDYKSIEGVIMAFRVEEPWRMEAYHTHGLLYELSASKICNIPFEKFLEAKAAGKDLPERKKIGKPSELAFQYGGGLGAGKAFGMGDYLTDQEIENAKEGYRAASPMIRKFWHKVQDNSIAAVRHPGHAFTYNGITYVQPSMTGPLECHLPAGSILYYHQPAVKPKVTPWGAVKDQLTYWGYNTNPKYGKVGWIEIDTFYGKLTENIIQREGNDVLNYGLLKVSEKFDVVMKTHDQLTAQAPIGTRCIEELESAMTDYLPPCYSGWPIKVSGSWRGNRWKK